MENWTRGDPLLAIFRAQRGFLGKRVRGGKKGGSKEIERTKEGTSALSRLGKVDFLERGFGRKKFGLSQQHLLL